MRRSGATEVVTSRGILHGGGRSIEYYTSQPSSSQWIALGVVPLSPEFDEDEATHRVLVGTGETEPAAIASLKSRLDELFLPAAAGSPVFDPANQAMHPSDWFG
jgi:hypothetical protein